MIEKVQGPVHSCNSVKPSNTTEPTIKNTTFFDKGELKECNDRRIDAVQKHRNSTFKNNPVKSPTDVDKET